MNTLKLALLTGFFCTIALPSVAQSGLRWSGLFYMDYEYLLSSPVEEAEGENGFDYRRMYLTADYTLSDEFSGRARLEAASEPVDSSPFVKDLYLKWKDAIGQGHDLIFGVQSPPSFTLSEKVWGYRSLERMVMDRQRIASSRDMGATVAGRLTADGKLTYDVMVGNNNSVRGEDDKYKRVYARLAWQSDNVAASIGGDYAAGDDRDARNANAFAGYLGRHVRVGAEGFFQQVDFDNTDVSTDRMGISGWVVKPVHEKVELVGRVDYVEIEFGGSSASETFVIGGVAFTPNARVHLIPNVYVVDTNNRSDPEVAARVTLHADF